jgi:hypothetical protein
MVKFKVEAGILLIQTCDKQEKGCGEYYSGAPGGSDRT